MNTLISWQKKTSCSTGLENQGAANLRKADETIENSRAAEEASNVALDKAEDVLLDLERLLELLRQIGVVNPGNLNQLGQTLDGLEDEILDMNLDEQLSRLEVGARQQEMLITKYTLDLTQLEKDVANVQDIREALPDGCYKNIKLEEHGLGGVGK